MTYTDQNAGRRTRLGVFEPINGSVADYWLEDGLPLDEVGIHGKNDLPSISISAGEFSHTVKDVIRTKAHYDLAGDEEGLDLIDAAGRTTILRFEN